MRLYLALISLFVLLSCNQPASSENKLVAQDSIFENTTSTDIKLERWFEPSSLDTQLILKDNIRLKLKNSDSIFMNEYFLDNVVLDSISAHFDNWNQRALEIEKRLLKTNGDIAKRDSIGLHVKLKNGMWKLLTPDTSTLDEGDHIFEYFFQDFGFYSVRVQWSEGNGYKLINYSNGEVTEIGGRPYFSANGEFMISVNADVHAAYSFNGFQLFKNDQGRLQMLGEYNPEIWGTVSAKWISQDEIILKNATVEIKDGNWGELEFYSELKIQNGD